MLCLNCGNNSAFYIVSAHVYWLFLWVYIGVGLILILVPLVELTIFTNVHSEYCFFLLVWLIKLPATPSCKVLLWLPERIRLLIHLINLRNVKFLKIIFSRYFQWLQNWLIKRNLFHRRLQIAKLLKFSDMIL